MSVKYWAYCAVQKYENHSCNFIEYIMKGSFNIYEQSHILMYDLTYLGFGMWLISIDYVIRPI